MNSFYRHDPQFSFRLEELLVDNFAGGGGASTGIEQAIGRPVDIAINHDPDSIAMHTVNHPTTKHYCENVWDIDPVEATGGMPVGLAWFSPDCKHFSKAKGGTPVNKEIRGLAWVAMRWAATVKPRIIMLENVEEFLTWGPVVDGKPCPERKGKIFNSFVKQLRAHGYSVQWKTLRACDFGAPTIRKRFFLVARCDGEAIQWPSPTHADPKTPGFKKSKLKPWKTAADIIDWSIPCPSIFERKKPLAENTLKRIARGIQRFVIDNPTPFIVRIGQQGFGGDGMQYSLDKPLTTITTKAEHCLVAPYLQKYYGSKSENEVRGSELHEPVHTVTTENRFALCTAFLAKHYGGNYNGAGSSPTDPLSTITATDHNALVTSHMVKLRGSNTGHPTNEPLHTVSAQGTHHGEVRAFLIKYYGSEKDGVQLTEPMHTIPTRDRFGLVMIHGEPYQIVDIGMRMLEPHELFAAQGFPKDYVIDVDSSGKPVPKYKQVARCGNSVCPPLAQALVASSMTQRVTAKERSAA